MAEEKKTVVTVLREITLEAEADPELLDPHKLKLIDQLRAIHNSGFSPEIVQAALGSSSIKQRSYIEKFLRATSHADLLHSKVENPPVSYGPDGKQVVWSGQTVAGTFGCLALIIAIVFLFLGLSDIIKWNQQRQPVPAGNYQMLWIGGGLLLVSLATFALIIAKATRKALRDARNKIATNAQPQTDTGEQKLEAPTANLPPVQVQGILVLAQRPVENSQRLLQQILDQQRSKGYGVAPGAILSVRVTPNPDDPAYLYAAIRTEFEKFGGSDLLDRTQQFPFHASDGNSGNYYILYDRAI